MFLGVVITVVLAQFAALAHGHACTTSLRPTDLAFNSVSLHDGTYGFIVKDWVTQPDKGDLIALPNGTVTIAQSNSGWRAAIIRLGTPAEVRARFNIAASISDETIFYSIRTNPLQCGSEQSQLLSPSAGSSCATQILQAPNTWIDIKSVLDTVPLSVAPSFDPNDGEIYLTRIVAQTSQGLRERLYSKVLVVFGAREQLVIRWSNLYNVRRWQGDDSFCSISAGSPTLMTDVVQSINTGPLLYDDTWIGVLLLLYAILFIVMMAIMFGLFYLASRRMPGPQSAPQVGAPPNLHAPGSSVELPPAPASAPVYQSSGAGAAYPPAANAVPDDFSL